MTTEAAGAALVLLAGGSGSRVGAAANKVLLPLGAESALVHALRTALRVEGVRRIVLVVRPEDRDEVATQVVPLLGDREVAVVDGGPTRHASESHALQVLRDDVAEGLVDVVAIHDAARPLARVELWRAVIDAAREHGGAVPIVTLPGLVAGDLEVPPVRLGGVQTPQAFAAAPLLSAYDEAARDGFAGTDTAACLERYAPVRVVAVPGRADNLKVTWPDDLALATRLLSD
ncbi:IspD/TarI family cytidylyltransferase [Alteromonas gracilis]